MRTADLLALAERERVVLANAGHEASAVVVELMAERLRMLKDRLDRAGLSVDPFEPAPLIDHEPDGIRLAG